MEKVMQETRDTIDILNESKKAREVLRMFNEECANQGISPDSEEYIELRKIAIMLAIYKEPKAMKNMAKEVWNYHNGFTKELG